MRVEYSARAVADLHKLAAESLAYGDAVAAAIEARLRQVIARIAAHPEAAQRVAGRPGVHVVPLVRYPFKVFYRVLDDRVRIFCISGTARAGSGPKIADENLRILTAIARIESAAKKVLKTFVTAGETPRCCSSGET